MQKRRTQHFKATLAVAAVTSCLLLLALAILGHYAAFDSFDLLANCIFAVLGLAGGSFLVFSFVPYFRGDMRWYSISALLTLAFFIGAGMIWQVPGMGMVL